MGGVAKDDETYTVCFCYLSFCFYPSWMLWNVQDGTNDFEWGSGAGGGALLGGIVAGRPLEGAALGAALGALGGYIAGEGGEGYRHRR